ncbi:MAG: mechanosensitive ion channel family protein [Cryobacterium sp.]|nr:mechanosensitive ion channel family protein [Oligoflexia bacterium]
MNSKLGQPWIPLAPIESMIQFEPVLMLVGLSIGAWLIYKILLRDASPIRHRNLRALFLNLLAHLAIFAILFIAYVLTEKGVALGGPNERLASYFGLATLVSGAIVFVKCSRIFMFEYLFLGHMKEGVPVLIVNLFSLLLSIGIAGWFATEIFGIRLAPVLATSAVFSLILGLALQDTIGNLFAGVALQLDKPYEIGHWVEIMTSGQTYVGQVEEITWRATTLIGLFDELLILPNRLMAASEISNFSARRTPIWRGQNFRLPYTADLAEMKAVLLGALQSAEGVRAVPTPYVWIRETTESWLVFRCSYTIDEYPRQFRIGSNVIAAVIEAMKKNGFASAAQKIQIVPDQGSGSARELPEFARRE